MNHAESIEQLIINLANASKFSLEEATTALSKSYSFELTDIQKYFMSVKLSKHKIKFKTKIKHY